MMQNGKARQRLRYKTRHMQESNRAAAMGETPPRGGDEDPTKCEHKQHHIRSEDLQRVTDRYVKETSDVQQ